MNVITNFLDKSLHRIFHVSAFRINVESIAKLGKRVVIFPAEWLRFLLGFFFVQSVAPVSFKEYLNKLTPVTQALTSTKLVFVRVICKRLPEYFLRLKIRYTSLNICKVCKWNQTSKIALAPRRAFKASTRPASKGHFQLRTGTLWRSFSITYRHTWKVIFNYVPTHFEGHFQLRTDTLWRSFSITYRHTLKVIFNYVPAHFEGHFQLRTGTLWRSFSITYWHTLKVIFNYVPAHFKGHFQLRTGTLWRSFSITYRHTLKVIFNYVPTHFEGHFQLRTDTLWRSFSITYRHTLKVIFNYVPTHFEGHFQLRTDTLWRSFSITYWHTLIDPQLLGTRNWTVAN